MYSDEDCSDDYGSIRTLADYRYLSLPAAVMDSDSKSIRVQRYVKALDEPIPANFGLPVSL